MKAQAPRLILFQLLSKRTFQLVSSKSFKEPNANSAPASQRAALKASRSPPAPELQETLLMLGQKQSAIEMGKQSFRQPVGLVAVCSTGRGQAGTAAYSKY